MRLTGFCENMRYPRCSAGGTFGPKRTTHQPTRAVSKDLAPRARVALRAAYAGYLAPLGSSVMMVVNRQVTLILVDHRKPIFGITGRRSTGGNPLPRPAIRKFYKTRLDSQGF